MYSNRCKPLSGFIALVVFVLVSSTSYSQAQEITNEIESGGFFFDASLSNEFGGFTVIALTESQCLAKAKEDYDYCVEELQEEKAYCSGQYAIKKRKCTGSGT